MLQVMSEVFRLGSSGLRPCAFGEGSRGGAAFGRRPPPAEPQGGERSASHRRLPRPPALSRRWLGGSLAAQGGETAREGPPAGLTALPAAPLGGLGWRPGGEAGRPGRGDCGRSPGFWSCPPTPPGARAATPSACPSLRAARPAGGPTASGALCRRRALPCRRATDRQPPLPEGALVLHSGGPLSLISTASAAPWPLQDAGEWLVAAACSPPRPGRRRPRPGPARPSWACQGSSHVGEVSPGGPRGGCRGSAGLAGGSSTPTRSPQRVVQPPGGCSRVVITPDGDPLGGHRRLPGRPRGVFDLYQGPLGG